MLRGIDMLRGHATERSWLPLRPLGREQGAGGMRVGSSTPLRTLSELVLASNTPQEPILLSNDWFDDIACDIGQSIIATPVTVSKLLVVESHEMKDRRV